MKLSALFVALTMAVGLMATPAAASDGVSGVVQDFFEWSVNAQRETGDAFWRAIYGDSWNPDGGFSDGVGADRAELVEKYGAYTETMETEMGATTIVEGGAARIYFDYPEPAWTLQNSSASSPVLIEIVNTGGVAPTVSAQVVYQKYESGKLILNSYRNSTYVQFSAPFVGSYTRGNTWVADWDTAGLYTENSGFSADPIAVNSGDNIRALDMTWNVNDYRDGGKFIGITARQWVDLVPYNGMGSVLSVDVAEPSRAGSIAGDVYVVNENGEEVVYNDYSVVNETTNIYNDPISGTERPMEDWAYDYIERQYNITLEDGANVTVKYGNENIEIVEGDSIETLNYGSGSSGEGGGDDGGGTGIGDAIANLFTVLGEIILGLITALINLATKALDALKGLFDLFGQLVETITGFFGGFTDFLAGVFPFLPEETFTIFNFGLILLVAATVFRKFLK